MKLLVLSDSHQYSFSGKEFLGYDAVIHCGDYGKSYETLLQHHVFFVRGNCDIYGESQQVIQLGSKKILLCHGHLQNVKYDFIRLFYSALEKKVDVCIFGHTHQPICFSKEGILFLNPGAYPSSYIEILDDEIILYANKEIKRFTYRW